MRTTTRKKTTRATENLSSPLTLQSAKPTTITKRPLPAPLRPENLAFARTLKNAMDGKQMTASDLARAIWGSSPDPRGFMVAKNRDRIGTYLSGTGYPSKETLPKLAAALGLSVDDLPVPRRSSSPREFHGSSDVTFMMLADHPGICSIRITKLLPIEVGLKIIDLINSVQNVEVQETAER